MFEMWRRPEPAAAAPAPRASTTAAPAYGSSMNGSHARPGPPPVVANLDDFARSDDFLDDDAGWPTGSHDAEHATAAGSDYDGDFGTSSASAYRAPLAKGAGASSAYGNGNYQGGGRADSWTRSDPPAGPAWDGLQPFQSGGGGGGGAGNGNMGAGSAGPATWGNDRERGTGAAGLRAAAGMDNAPPTEPTMVASDPMGESQMYPWTPQIFNALRT